MAIYIRFYDDCHKQRGCAGFTNNAVPVVWVNDYDCAGSSGSQRKWARLLHIFLLLLDSPACAHKRRSARSSSSSGQLFETRYKQATQFLSLSLSVSLFLSSCFRVFNQRAEISRKKVAFFLSFTVCSACYLPARGSSCLSLRKILTTHSWSSKSFTLFFQVLDLTLTVSLIRSSRIFPFECFKRNSSALQCNVNVKYWWQYSVSHRCYLPS